MIENDKELALLLKSKIITPTIPLEKSKEVTIKESTPLEKTIILTWSVSNSGSFIKKEEVFSWSSFIFNWDYEVINSYISQFQSKNPLCFKDLNCINTLRKDFDLYNKSALDFEIKLWASISYSWALKKPNIPKKLTAVKKNINYTLDDLYKYVLLNYFSWSTTSFNELTYNNISENLHIPYFWTPVWNNFDELLFYDKNFNYIDLSYFLNARKYNLKLQASTNIKDLKIWLLNKEPILITIPWKVIWLNPNIWYPILLIWYSEKTNKVEYLDFYRGVHEELTFDRLQKNQTNTYTPFRTFSLCQ